MLEQQIIDYISAVTLAAKGLPKIIKKLHDSNIPLKERWEAYLSIYEHLPYDDWSDSEFREMIDNDWWNRYETYDYVDSIEELDVDDEANEDIFEHVLSSGARGFKHDW